MKRGVLQNTESRLQAHSTILLLGLHMHVNRVGEGKYPRVAYYCRTSDNVRPNLKVILIGHWSDHKKIVLHYTFFWCEKIRLQIHSICILQ
jgi:hypothetical protein